MPDLVLLDVMLPDGSGYDVARTLRERSKVPIIMLTARGEETDRSSASNSAPTTTSSSPSARVRWPRGSGRCCAAPATRNSRRRRPRTPARSRSAPSRVDRDRREARVNDEEIDLTRKEFELPEPLIREAGTVISRERLIDEVWDTNCPGSTKTLDVHVLSLRRKLGDDSQNPRFIHTVRGVGFRFAAADEL